MWAPIGRVTGMYRASGVGMLKKDLIDVTG
jgi:hypothetical protein